MSNNNRVLYGVLAAVLLLAVVALGVYAYQQYYNDSTNDTDTSTTETSNSDGGESSGENTNETPASTSYQSEKGTAITVSMPTQGVAVASPLHVEGSVPGSWSSEGQFTVRLLDANGATLAEQPALLSGDWMTESPVPFTAMLEFTAPEAGTNGTLVLEKANPSGLEENADSLSIPVQF